MATKQSNREVSTISVLDALDSDKDSTEVSEAFTCAAFICSIRKSISLLKSSFNAQQQSSLQDYILLMLQYNVR